MKRLLVIGLVMVYSISAVGVPLHYHYCKGDLEHVTLLVQKECSDHDEEPKRLVDSPFACCLKGKMSCESSTEKGDCCDDQAEFLQLDEDAIQVFVDLTELTQFVTSAEAVDIAVSDREMLVEPCANGPPDYGPPVYLLNCSFMFYG